MLIELNYDLFLIDLLYLSLHPPDFVIGGCVFYGIDAVPRLEVFFEFVDLAGEILVVLLYSDLYIYFILYLRIGLEICFFSRQAVH